MCIRDRLRVAVPCGAPGGVEEDTLDAVERRGLRIGVQHPVRGCARTGRREVVTGDPRRERVDLDGEHLESLGEQRHRLGADAASEIGDRSAAGLREAACVQSRHFRAARLLLSLIHI